MLGAFVLIMFVVMQMGDGGSSSSSLSPAEGVRQVKRVVALYAEKAARKNNSVDFVRSEVCNLMSALTGEEYYYVDGTLAKALGAANSGNVPVSTLGIIAEGSPSVTFDDTVDLVGADGSRVVHKSAGTFAMVPAAANDIFDKMLRSALVGRAVTTTEVDTKNIISAMKSEAERPESFRGRKSRMGNRRFHRGSPYNRIRSPASRRERFDPTNPGSAVTPPQGANNFLPFYTSSLGNRDANYCKQPGATDWSKEAAAEALVFAAMSGERSNSDEDVLRKYAQEAANLQCSGTIPSAAADELKKYGRDAVLQNGAAGSSGQVSVSPDPLLV